MEFLSEEVPLVPLIQMPTPMLEVEDPSLEDLDQHQVLVLDTAVHSEVGQDPVPMLVLVQVRMLIQAMFLCQVLRAHQVNQEVQDYLDHQD